MTQAASRQSYLVKSFLPHGPAVNSHIGHTTPEHPKDTLFKGASPALTTFGTERHSVASRQALFVIWSAV